MDDRSIPKKDAPTPARDSRADRRLRAVADADATTAPGRTIGRLIAQTALIADSALSRRNVERDKPRPRRFGLF
jgi:hypothetical protein